MIKFIVFFMSFFLANAQTQMDIDFLRAHYKKAVIDKKICNDVITTLQNDEQPALIMAYLGGYQAIWAKHTISPIGKLNTFREGKRNIEKAIAKDPNNPEIRFLRWSIQKNTPAFLGYNANIKEDEAFLKSFRHKIVSNIVQKQINELLEK